MLLLLRLLLRLRVPRGCREADEKEDLMPLCWRGCG